VNMDRSTVFVYQESKRMIELPGRRTWRSLWLLRGAPRKAVCVSLMDFDGNILYTSVTEVV
jgi:hypothetical protein